MILCFELTMPHTNSWDNKWSGADSGHYIFKTSQAVSWKKKCQELDGKEWYYNWPDGWGATITANIVTAGEAAKLRKRNTGFCGYDWMVKDILAFGEIHER